MSTRVHVTDFHLIGIPRHENTDDALHEHGHNHQPHYKQLAAVGATSIPLLCPRKKCNSNLGRTGLQKRSALVRLLMNPTHYGTSFLIVDAFIIDILLFRL